MLGKVLYLVICVTIFLCSSSLMAAEEYVFAQQWPEEILGFRHPVGVAVDSFGYVYIADTNDNRIQKFTSDGTYLTQWGAFGSGNGQFNKPSGIAVDSFGNVYVVDTDNNRIQKFSSTGAYLTKWGTSGSGNGQFYSPDSVAVDSSGNVYVADSFNDRVQKFNSNGVYLTQWGGTGSSDGFFHYPKGIAVDSLGNVYVADTWNNRIQKFTSSGEYLKKWGTSGSGNGQFNGPVGIAVDKFGNVYVADSYNYRVQKSDSDGTYLAKWGAYGSADEQFYVPEGIAVDSSGNVYVADTGNNRLQKFTSSGTYLKKWGTEASNNGQFHYPSCIAIDNMGNCYVSDTTNNRVQKLDSNGTYLTKWGTYGVDTKQFKYPKGIAVDNLRNVYVVDSWNNRVQKFDSGGTYLVKWGTYGSTSAKFEYPEGIAADNFNNVFVVDSGNNRIQKFNSGGTYQGQWGVKGSEIGQFDEPYGIATDSSGNVYVTDATNSRVQKFGSNGVFLTQWGTYGTGNGQFDFPKGIAVDSSGYVYVVDSSNHRVQKFTSNGAYLTKWGTKGSGHGQFYYPEGIAVDSNGNIYVVDTWNHRIQVFCQKSASQRILPDQAVQLAKSLIGADYRRGGKGYDLFLREFVEPNKITTQGYNYFNPEKGKMDSGKGIDGPGLIFWAYNKAFFGDRHLTGTDYESRPVYYEETNLQYNGNVDKIIKSKLKPGDLLFFDENPAGDGMIDHVAMYIGPYSYGGKEYNTIHAIGPAGKVMLAYYNPVNETLTTSVNGVPQVLTADDYGRIKDARSPDFQVTARSPIDLMVTTPRGEIITKEKWQSPTMEYQIYDIDEDGNLDDIVVAREREKGNYQIKVIPEPNALPAQTYSLDVKMGDDIIVLAKDARIGDIPEQPYVVSSTSDTFTIYLKKGWNLISMPISPTNKNLTSVMLSVDGDYKSVWAFDPISKSWLKYIVGGNPSLNNLNTVDAGIGYLVYMSESSYLSIQGTVYNSNVSLKAGWNLAGYPSMASRLPQNVLAGMPEGTCIYRYNEENNTWLRYIPGGPGFLNSLSLLEPGHGYYIYIKQDWTWAISP